jgi:hypothetical protein
MGRRVDNRLCYTIKTREKENRKKKKEPGARARM